MLQLSTRDRTRILWDYYVIKEYSLTCVIQFTVSKSATPNQPTPLEVPSTPQPQTATFKQHKFITTPQQYLEWFEQIDKSIDSEHESKYQHHLDKLDNELKLHYEMLRGVDLLDKEIATLKSNWENIDNGTADLKKACQSHLDQRDDLIAAKKRLLEKQST